MSIWNNSLMQNRRTVLRYELFKVREALQELGRVQYPAEAVKQDYLKLLELETQLFNELRS